MLLRTITLIWFTIVHFALGIGQVNAKTGDVKYGSFIYDPQIEKTLFFFDDIDEGDAFEFRKATRNHEIENIVLGSNGGSVWEGLSIAGIIFDKGMNVYVPKGAQCASACSYMFFAGHQRKASGKLGVHQFYSDSGSAKANVNKIQEMSQFTVSEIVGFLNEFGTPMFVLEKMFQQTEMYWFNSIELVELESTDYGLSQQLLSVIDTKTASLQNNKATSITKLENEKIAELRAKFSLLSKRAKVKLVQEELNRVGCPVGQADGVAGKKTTYAVKQAAKNLSLDELPADNFELYLALALEENAVCDYKLPDPTTVRKSPPKVAKLNFANSYDTFCGQTPGRAIAAFDYYDPKINEGRFSLSGDARNYTKFRLNGTSIIFLGKDSHLSPGKIYKSKNGYVHTIKLANNHCSSITLKAR